MPQCLMQTTLDARELQCNSHAMKQAHVPDNEREKANTTKRGMMAPERSHLSLKELRGVSATDDSDNQSIKCDFGRTLTHLGHPFVTQPTGEGH